MKGLGKARRIDEAFQLLESVENGTAMGRPKLSAQLVFGLLNALIEVGESDSSVLHVPFNSFIGSVHSLSIWTTGHWCRSYLGVTGIVFNVPFVSSSTLQ